MAGFGGVGLGALFAPVLVKPLEFPADLRFALGFGRLFVGLDFGGQSFGEAARHQRFGIIKRLQAAGFGFAAQAGSGGGVVGRIAVLLFHRGHFAAERRLRVLAGAAEIARAARAFGAVYRQPQRGFLIVAADFGLRFVAELAAGQGNQPAVGLQAFLFVLFAIISPSLGAAKAGKESRAHKAGTSSFFIGKPVAGKGRNLNRIGRRRYNARRRFRQPETASFCLSTALEMPPMIAVSARHDLQPLHTFGLSARAAAFCTLENESQLPEIINLPEFDPATVLWLGGGSNVLFMRDYPGLVVKMANKGIRIIGERQDGRVLVQAQAGEIWHDFVQEMIARELYGAENLSLIPGTVGAAPVQNIGAYGVEVKDLVHSVRCYDLAQRCFVELTQVDCRFAYRDSLFKGEGKGCYVICAVTFALSRRFTPKLGYGNLDALLAAEGKTAPSAREVAAAVCRIRREKLPDPAQTGNAGSFYKNPLVDAAAGAALLARYPDMPHYPQPDGSLKLAAGWLIEQAGLKGRQIGGAAVHERQALVLVNRGGATAEDVRRLSDEVRATVKERFGVELEAEPVWLPAGA